LVKARGGWQEMRGGPNYLVFQDDRFIIAYRSPFQKLPALSGDVVRAAMAHGLTAKNNLPHGLDIWQGAAGQVLNVEWSEEGEAIVVGYKPGLWEQELERLAAAAS
jgi:hypothetical protein